LFAITTVLVELSGGDVTSGTIHLFVLLLDQKETGEVRTTIFLLRSPINPMKGV
jgi:hypothetical protein